MKKLHSFAFYALAAPVLTFSASTVLAQQPAGQDTDRQQQNTQHERDVTPSTSTTQEGNQNTQREQDTTPSALRTQEDNQDTKRNNLSGSQTQEYLNAIPARGTKASNLIGADVQTIGDEDIGSVDDLIINENGQIVAIVVSVGGFLGMGQKDVAIGWDNVTKSGGLDKQELRVNITRNHLRSAPEFKNHK